MQRSITKYDTSTVVSKDYPCISPKGPSGPVSVIEQMPSNIISELAGTSNPLVSHLTSSTGLPTRDAMYSASETPSGSGMLEATDKGR
jgi:hypothetical protein